MRGINKPEHDATDKEVFLKKKKEIQKYLIL